MTLNLHTQPVQSLTGISSRPSLKLAILESIRGFAAVYVAIGHLVLSFTELPTFLLFLFRFGQEAVIIFFLISGFVIHYSNRNTDTFGSYFIKRFRRIFGPLIMAMLLSITILYFNNPGFARLSPGELLGNLLMLQDFGSAKPGSWVNCFLGNTPLWSLSYEWWFYMLYYPVKTYIHTPTKIYLIFCFSAFSWLFYLLVPNHLTLVFSYFLLWWSGVELAELHQNRSLNLKSRKVKQILLLNILMMILAAYPILYFTGNIKFGLFPVLTFRHFASGVVFIIGAFLWHRFRWKGFNRLFGSFKLLSPISYGIYIVHYPVFFHLLLPVENMFIDVSIRILLVIGIAYLIEIHIQPYINRWLSSKMFVL